MNVSKLTMQKMIAVTAMALAVPLSAYAGHHEGGDKNPHSEMHHHYKHGGMGMLKQLDLTEAQQAQIKQIMEKQRAEIDAVLTPEQREKAKVIRAEWKEKMKDRYKKRKADDANNPM